ncbi:hypothetical protein GQ44DRAFT_826396 [Phaeosphaeriaceae sp. PMI808]|nr:hypothetical protein GQ44DRAFT_826396 [Phaeosphaeriaceae sp. PMI808]
MRIFNCTPLLLAAVPIAVANIEGGCTGIEVRCSSQGGVEECKGGAFVPTSSCNDGTTCMVSMGVDKNFKVACVEPNSPELQLSSRSGTADQPEDTCSPKSRRCENSIVQECGNSGQWANVRKCSEDEHCADKDGSNNNTHCRPFVVNMGLKQCLPSKIRCHENEVQHCVHGIWETSKLCTSDQVCYGNQCRAKMSRSTNDDPSQYSPPLYGCTLGTKRCQDKVIQKCNNHSMWEFFRECTGNQYCFAHWKFLDGADCLTHADKGERNECDVKARRCHNNTIQECTTRNIWQSQKPCGYGEACLENCSRNGCSPFCQGGSLRANNTDTPPMDQPKREACDRPGMERCIYSPVQVQKCTTYEDNKSYWTEQEQCSAGAICWADDEDSNGLPRATCNKLRIPRSEHNQNDTIDCPSTPCWPGEQTCSKDYYSLLTCTKEREWQTQKKCTTPGDCSIDGYGKAHCQRGGIDPPKFKRYATRSKNADPVETTACPPRPCSPGEQTCSEDFYSLLVCTENREWLTQKKCTTPGDCSIDGFGKAHCQRGGIAPPKARRAISTRF